MDEICSWCGALYGPEHRKGWGRTTGINYGRRAVCTALVDAQGERLKPGDAVTPGHVCGGELRPNTNTALALDPEPTPLNS